MLAAAATSTAAATPITSTGARAGSERAARCPCAACRAGAALTRSSSSSSGVTVRLTSQATAMPAAPNAPSSRTGGIAATRSERKPSAVVIAENVTPRTVCATARRTASAAACSSRSCR